MSQQLIVNDSLLIWAESPQMTAMEFASALGVIGRVVVTLWCIAMSFRDVGSASYERLEHEPGGVLFGRWNKHAEYWLSLPMGSGLRQPGVAPRNTTVTWLFSAALAAVSSVCGRFGPAGLVLVGAALCYAFDGMAARLGDETTEIDAKRDATICRMQKIHVLSATALADHQWHSMIWYACRALVTSSAARHAVLQWRPL